MKEGKFLKVLGIAGSPRKGGNSEYLLAQVMEEAGQVDEDVEIKTYSIAGKKFAPCLACSKCVELKGECVQKDDFQQLKDEWLKADVVIYSVPVYHMTIPGQLRCFMDRLGKSLSSYYGGMIAKNVKVIGAIAQGVHIFSGQEHTMTDIINHALLMGCVPVGGDTWESAYIGGGGWTFNEREKDALKKHYERGDLEAVVAVRAARSVGKRAAQFALMLKEGAIVKREMLEKEEAVFAPFLARL